MNPTQVKYPWRATLRTVLAVLVGAGIVTPIVWNIAVEQLGAYVPPNAIAAGAWAVGLIVAVSGVVTRVMAIPQVNGWLTKINVGATPTPPPLLEEGLDVDDDDNSDNAVPEP